MAFLQLPSHGSNTKHLYESLHLERPEKVSDFSVNLNPLGTPVKLQEKWGQWFTLINDYPDPYTNILLEQLAEKENIPITHLLAGNGAAEMITLLARYLAGRKVAVIHPAFSEYETACKNEGCEIVQVVLSAPDWKLQLQELEKELWDVAAVFLCNPNNPTGVHYESEAVEALITACASTNTLCIIDEAFYDFLQEPVTFIQEVQNTEHLVIIRSLTKMYCIAGLRLGFLAGNPALLQQIGKTQPHWSVNALAMKAGVACLKDKEHVATTQSYISKERMRLFKKLEELGFEHSPSQLNFYLLRDPAMSGQEKLFHDLLEQGIVLRHTENFPGIKGKWLRAAIKQTAENNLLMEALAAWKQEN